MSIMHPDRMMNIDHERNTTIFIQVLSREKGNDILCFEGRTE